MRTLDYWKSRLEDIPNTIECPEMRLLSGRDHESPVFVGPGQIEIKNSTAISFKMYATPTNTRDAIERLIRAQENPYEVFEQFRLVATDYEGTEWNGGWTRPQLVGNPKIGWPLTGKVEFLVTVVSGPLVSQDSGVELVFQPKLHLPMAKTMTSITSRNHKEIKRSYGAGQHTVKVLDSEITFFYEPSDESLWVTARTSNKLPHPFAENWIGQPFRVLFGQLIYPRLVARNLGNGKAHVSLRPSPRRFSNSDIASLLGKSSFVERAQFWALYKKLLKLIAEARDAEGHRNFHSHPVTRFYEEIAQATQGSKWILCMTLASTGEGIANMLMSRAERASEFAKNDIKNLRSHLQSWKGKAKLKERALSGFAHLGQRSAANYLRRLVKRGVLDESNERAWSAVRNAVMHGNLVAPWATEQDDNRIRALADLVRRLTRKLIGNRP